MHSWDGNGSLLKTMRKGRQERHTKHLYFLWLLKGWSWKKRWEKAITFAAADKRQYEQRLNIKSLEGKKTDQLSTWAAHLKVRHAMPTSGQKKEFQWACRDACGTLRQHPRSDISSYPSSLYLQYSWVANLDKTLFSKQNRIQYRPLQKNLKNK